MFRILSIFVFCQFNVWLLGFFYCERKLKICWWTISDIFVCLLHYVGVYEGSACVSCCSRYMYICVLYALCVGERQLYYYYITKWSVRWYYSFSIAAAGRPWRREHSNSKNIQPISFKFYIWVDTPLRYFAIEIWYPPRTRTTAFAAKRHSYPPNLQNAISPYVMVRLLSNFIQRWSTWSYIKKMVND